MTTSQKVAYLKGMFDGMNLDVEKSKEAKLLGAVIEILEDMSADLMEVDERFGAVSEQLDALSDDMSDLEEIVYDDDDDDDDGDDDFFEIECPNCGEPMYISEAVLEEGTVQCPECEQRFVLDLCGEGCECGCGHDDDDDDDDDDDVDDDDGEISF